MIDHLSAYAEENTDENPRPGNELRHPNYFIGHQKIGTPHKPPEGEGNKWGLLWTRDGPAPAG